MLSSLELQDGCLGVRAWCTVRQVGLLQVAAVDGGHGVLHALQGKARYLVKARTYDDEESCWVRSTPYCRHARGGYLCHGGGRGVEREEPGSRDVAGEGGTE